MVFVPPPRGAHANTTIPTSMLKLNAKEVRTKPYLSISTPPANTSRMFGAEYSVNNDAKSSSSMLKYACSEEPMAPVHDESDTIKHSTRA